jgi:hypothetical protein
VPVFLGSLGQTSVAITEEEVTIRWGDVDLPGLDPLAVAGMPGGKRTGSTEYAG